jgi:hypothetical protein
MKFSTKWVIRIESLTWGEFKIISVYYASINCCEIDVNRGI